MKRKMKKKLEELMPLIHQIDNETTALNMEDKIYKIIEHDDLNYHFNNGKTLLMEAAYLGYTEIVSILLLLELEYYYEGIQNIVEAAMSEAIIGKQIDTLNLLIHTNLLNKEYYSCVLVAAINNYDFEIMKLIINNSIISLESALFEVLDHDLKLKDRKQILKYLLHYKSIDINKSISSSENHIPLIKAIKEQADLEIINILLDYGADINVSGELLITPLMIASEQNMYEIAERLIELGADIDKKDYFGRTALMIAAGTNNKEIVKLLLSHGANINEADEQLDTSLHVAIRKHHLEMVKLLLSYNNANAIIIGNNPYGANPNVKNEYGISPLYEAVKINNFEIVKLLIDYGAIIDNQIIGTAFIENNVDIAMYLYNKMNNIEDINIKKLTN